MLNISYEFHVDINKIISLISSCNFSSRSELPLAKHAPRYNLSRACICCLPPSPNVYDPPNFTPQPAQLYTPNTIAQAVATHDPATVDNAEATFARQKELLQRELEQFDTQQPYQHCRYWESLCIESPKVRFGGRDFIIIHVCILPWRVLPWRVSSWRVLPTRTLVFAERLVLTLHLPLPPTVALIPLPTLIPARHLQTHLPPHPPPSPTPSSSRVRRPRRL